MLGTEPYREHDYAADGHGGQGQTDVPEPAGGEQPGVQQEGERLGHEDRERDEGVRERVGVDGQQADADRTQPGHDPQPADQSGPSTHAQQRYCPQRLEEAEGDERDVHDHWGG